MKGAFRTETFNADFDEQYRWYLEQGGEETAVKFQNAVMTTLQKLATRQDLGKLRRFRQQALRGIRSFQVERPFNRILVFYHSTEDGITAWRLMDGARDLPRRLVEPPTH